MAIRMWSINADDDAIRADVRPDGEWVKTLDHLAVVKQYRDALEALVAVDDGIGEGDSFETAAQTVNDLDAAMQQARALLAEAKGRHATDEGTDIRRENSFTPIGL